MITSQLGNLLARIMSKKLIKNMKGDMTEHAQPEFDQQLLGVRDEVGRRMEEFHVTKACEEIMEILMQVRRQLPLIFPRLSSSCLRWLSGSKAKLIPLQANKTFTKLEPWLMADTTVPVLYVYESLRIAAILLQPIMPVKAVELLDRLGVEATERGWKDAVWRDRKEVDVESLRGQLERAMKDWKSRGHLFPRVAGPGETDVPVRSGTLG